MTLRWHPVMLCVGCGKLVVVGCAWFPLCFSYALFLHYRPAFPWDNGRGVCLWDGSRLGLHSSPAALLHPLLSSLRSSSSRSSPRCFICFSGGFPAVLCSFDHTAAGELLRPSLIALRCCQGSCSASGWSPSGDKRAVLSFSCLQYSVSAFAPDIANMTG